LIKPTIGRVVLYNAGTEQRVPALISFVHSHQCINIGGFKEGGQAFAKQSVTLVQGDEPCGLGQAEWMDYQKMQVAKSDAPRDPEPPVLTEETAKKENLGKHKSKKKTA